MFVPCISRICILLLTELPSCQWIAHHPVGFLTAAQHVCSSCVMSPSQFPTKVPHRLNSPRARSPRNSVPAGVVWFTGKEGWGLCVTRMLCRKIEGLRGRFITGPNPASVVMVAKLKVVEQ
ncbi:hypothetical protein LZ31DRAFT_344387 [Colletotrichum somersetense]|nr:hypothetical protein LZ31DRAFT_344387 [Colletotrichum somersetense]